MNKRGIYTKKLLIIIPVALIVFTISVFALTSFSQYFEIGKKIKENSEKSKGEIIATVNGQEIWESDLEQNKALQEISVFQMNVQLESQKQNFDKETYDTLKKENVLKSDKELLDKIILKTVMQQDIAEKKISVTEMEIEDAVNNTLKILENAKSNTANDDYYSNFVDLLSGMGYTMEQYKTDLLPKAMEYMLKANKYYEYQKEQIVKKNPKLTADEIKKEYEDNLDKLKKAADVKIFINLK